MEKNQLRVYVVDDEREVSNLIVLYLEREGYQAKAFYDGTEAQAAIKADPPDLAILDIMLPGRDGLEILKSIGNDQKFPVILLTGRKEENDRIIGLELGADDYVPKPFSPRELIARVNAIFRRIETIRNSASHSPLQKAEIRSGDLTLDLAGRRLLFNGASFHLTSMELSLMELLMGNPGRVFPRSELLLHVWDNENIGETRTIDVHVRNLRQKLQALIGSSSSIQSVRGVGYKFEN